MAIATSCHGDDSKSDFGSGALKAAPAVLVTSDHALIKNTEASLPDQRIRIESPGLTIDDTTDFHLPQPTTRLVLLLVIFTLLGGRHLLHRR